MVINTNSAAVDAASSLQKSNILMNRSLTRLSSGTKIVNPSDDAAGLSISEKLEAQNTRISAAKVNTQNAASLLQTTDGFLSSMNDIVDRMSELSLLAKDATKNSGDIELYRGEFDQLKDQLRDIIGTDGNWNTSNEEPSGSFNGIILFGAREDMNFVVGSSGDQTMSISETDLREVGGAIANLLWDSAVGGDAANGGQDNISVDSEGVVEVLTDAISAIANERAKIGATQSRLDTVNAQLTIESENLTAANSRIRDVDVAEESTRLARSNILIQSGTAMLQQANSLPDNVLRLLS